MGLERAIGGQLDPRRTDFPSPQNAFATQTTKGLIVELSQAPGPRSGLPGGLSSLGYCLQLATSHLTTCMS